MDSIHDKFVVSVQSMDSRYKVFQVISEWIEHLKTAQFEDPTQTELQPDKLEQLKLFLEMEQDTWSLILTLYYFRLENGENGDETMSLDEMGIDVADDELTAFSRIVEKDKTLKEIGIILTWLETNTSKQVEPDLVEKFINWEQTLESLKRESKLDLKGTKPMVTKMDPDACFREGKEVHAIDYEDDLKVMRGAFYYVRSGQNLKAIDFLFESGHAATAAMLNGFMYTEKMSLNFDGTIYGGKMLTDDDDIGGNDTSFFPRINSDSQEFAVLGNSERDLWKATAFEICEVNGLSKYGRASLGALCGHRRSLLDVASSWEDKLWSYLKIIFDVRVEGELRRLSTNAELVALPDKYWAQESSLAECMTQVQSGDADFVGNVYKIFQLVQKYIILDDTEGLLANLREGLTRLLDQDGHKPVVNRHLLRFLTHLLLSFGVVGLSYDEDLMNICTESYIKVLVREGKLSCIPFYVGKLSSERQIPVIVDQISADVDGKRDSIELFMQAAHVNDLDLLGIAVAIVGKLRDSQQDFDVENLFWITSCYQLVPNPREVMLSFLQNTIVLIRKFLTLNNLPTCNQLIRQVSDDIFAEVCSLSEEYEETLVRECFCYKVYLEAEDSLLLWQRSLRQKPMADLADFDVSQLSVAERTLQEKKSFDLKAAEGKWQKAMSHHLKNAIEKFFSVLTFSNGWLVDCVTPTNETEFNSVKAVRRLILPKVVFVLIKLITEQNSLPTMRRLVYIICEDSRDILRELTTTEISSLFKAVEEFVRRSSTTLTILPNFKLIIILLLALSIQTEGHPLIAKIGKIIASIGKHGLTKAIAAGATFASTDAIIDKIQNDFPLAL